jgi:hypothetical protein
LRSDIKLILGDLNTGVVYEDENEYVGEHSLHTEHNDNGRRLIGFDTSHGMVIGGTLFPHKDIHKAI